MISSPIFRRSVSISCFARATTLSRSAFGAVTFAVSAGISSDFSSSPSCAEPRGRLLFRWASPGRRGCRQTGKQKESHRVSKENSSKYSQYSRRSCRRLSVLKPVKLNALIERAEGNPATNGAQFDHIIRDVRSWNSIRRPTAGYDVRRGRYPAQAEDTRQTTAATDRSETFRRSRNSWWTERELQSLGWRR